MAAMFAMQSLGRVLAYVVALGALSSIAEDSFDHRIEVDRIWRLVVGIGAVPALLAIGLRLTIPETPRYYAGIERNLKKAVRAVEKVGGKPDDLQSIHSDVVPTRGGDLDRSPPWISSAWNYLFGPTKAWKSLLGISVLWFLLDVAFYGLGLDSPSTLHRLWMPHPPDPVTNYTYTSMAPVTAATSFSTATLTLERSITTTITELFITAAPTAEPSSTPVTVTRVLSTNLPWNPDQDDRCATIADSLKTTAIRTLLLSSIASGIGSIAAIAVINYFSRRRLMSVTSDILCLLFFASGFSVWCATETPANEVSMVLFALTQFVFNLGPNTLTFIIAAESFPTVFRGTFYGIEVASGKLGALLIRPVMHSIKDDDDSLMGVLFGFCGVTLSMAGASLVPGWMVDIQHPRTRRGETSLQKAERGRTGWLLEPLRSRTLEEIAPNPHSQEKERTGNAPDIMEEGKGIETTGNVDSAV